MQDTWPFQTHEAREGSLIGKCRSYRFSWKTSYHKATDLPTHVRLSIHKNIFIQSAYYKAGECSGIGTDEMFRILDTFSPSPSRNNNDIFYRHLPDVCQDHHVVYCRDGTASLPLGDCCRRHPAGVLNVPDRHPCGDSEIVYVPSGRRHVYYRHLFFLLPDDSIPVHRAGFACPRRGDPHITVA